MIDYFFLKLQPIAYWAVGAWVLVAAVLAMLILFLWVGKLISNERSIHVADSAVQALKICVAVAAGLLLLVFWVGCFITLPGALGHAVIAILGPR